jgi:hypothetical protein
MVVDVVDAARVRVCGRKTGLHFGNATFAIDGLDRTCGRLVSKI